MEEECGQVKYSLKILREGESHTVQFNAVESSAVR
jgi:hypothetical protein